MSTFGAFSGFGQSTNQNTGGFGSTTTNPTTTGKFSSSSLPKLFSPRDSVERLSPRPLHRIRTLTSKIGGQASVQASEALPQQRILSEVAVAQAASALEVGRLFQLHKTCSANLRTPSKYQRCFEHAAARHSTLYATQHQNCVSPRKSLDHSGVPCKPRIPNSLLLMMRQLDARTS
jgi:hypothetical protein